MTESYALHRFARAALKWRDLVERRCEHFVDLHKSGRWKHYYDEAEFLAAMREALDYVETWSRLAPRPGETAASDPTEMPYRAAA